MILDFKFDDGCLFLRPIGDSDDGSDSQENPESVQAEETAAKICKKAGLPEIQLDALPSSLSTKFMNLRLRKNRPLSICFLQIAVTSIGPLVFRS